MPFFQYAGFRFNFNCWLSGFNTLASSLIFSQAVQTLGSIAEHDPPSDDLRGFDSPGDSPTP